jgi:Domain of unknown function (DUF4386)
MAGPASGRCPESLEAVEDQLEPDLELVGELVARPHELDDRLGEVGVLVGGELLEHALPHLDQLAGFGYLAVVDRLVMADDAVRTAANIAASETLFRLAIASLLVVAVLDAVVAWALFIAQLAGVLRLLPEAEELAARVLSGVHAYEDIYSVGLVLFGFHLALLGVLVYRITGPPPGRSGAGYRASCSGIPRRACGPSASGTGPA